MGEQAIYDMIAQGSNNNEPTYTVEEGTQADRFLNISPGEEGNTGEVVAQDSVQCSAEV